MLTTSRKIEIAQAVMDDPRLGKNLCYDNKMFIPDSICNILNGILLNEREAHYFNLDMLYFFREIGGNPQNGCYWFDHSCEEKSRTERIEFLQKYINHLKQQENE